MQGFNQGYRLNGLVTLHHGWGWRWRSGETAAADRKIVNFTVERRERQNSNKQRASLMVFLVCF
jgi:hypothetical protein